MSFRTLVVECRAGAALDVRCPSGHLRRAAALAEAADEPAALGAAVEVAHDGGGAGVADAQADEVAHDLAGDVVAAGAVEEFDAALEPAEPGVVAAAAGGAGGQVGDAGLVEGAGA